MGIIGICINSGNFVTIVDMATKKTDTHPIQFCLYGATTSSRKRSVDIPPIPSDEASSVVAFFDDDVDVVVLDVAYFLLRRSLTSMRRRLYFVRSASSIQ